MLRPLLKNGKLTSSFEDVDKIRARVRRELEELRTATPSLKWR